MILAGAILGIVCVLWIVFGEIAFEKWMWLRNGSPDMTMKEIVWKVFTCGPTIWGLAFVTTVVYLYKQITEKNK